MQRYLELERDVDFCAAILSVTNIEKDYQLDVFPNPSNKMITIEWDGHIYDDFEIFDSIGRRITGFSGTGGRKFIDVSDWHSGVYFLRINRMELRSIIIQH